MHLQLDEKLHDRCVEVNLSLFHFVLTLIDSLSMLSMWCLSRLASNVDGAPFTVRL